MPQNTGKAYEEFVRKIHQALIDSETHASQKNIQIEKNKKLVDRFGLEREFDLYWEYTLGGIVYKSVIECKDYNSSITVDKIDALIGKINDFPGITPIFATKVGYQSGAKEKADKHKINLLIVREQKDKDWQDDDGTPYIREVNMSLVALLPARITSFVPILDEDWLDLNYPNLDTSLQLSMRNDEVIIEDVVNNEKYSLHDLERSLRSKHTGSDGSFNLKQEFEEAYLQINKRLKLRGYSLTYEIYPNSTSNINIDFTKELIGVIEYLRNNTKVLVFKDKNCK